VTRDVFLGRLRGVRPAGTGWLAFCPAHEDRAKPSLSVTVEGSRLLVHCFVGCTPEAIVRALGLRMRDLFLDGAGTAPREDTGEPVDAPSHASRVVATYDYRDEQGDRLYQVLRFEPKAFRPRRPDGRWGLGDARRVLYRLPDLAGQARSVLCEGEKDVEALWALGIPATTSPGGASGWRDEYAAQLVAAGVREVVILPDHDEAGERYAAAVARACLAQGLGVKLVRLPDLPLKGDVSDWLANGGTGPALTALIEATPILDPGDVNRLRSDTSPPAPQVVAAGPYRIEQGRIVRERPTRDGIVTEPLCNFAAAVTEEWVLDDGAEPTRAFLVEGRLETGEPLPAARVPSARFAAMSWVTESWGLRAVVRAGLSTRDCLREAIQRLSPHMRARRVYTHTGWREVDGAWVYLTAGGGVGRADLEVDLGPELARYHLPRIPLDPAEAMRGSLELLTVAPFTVTVPLWAAVYRAPLATALSPDASVWVEGQTGSLKSTLAALFLAHYGDFDRLHLPGAWSSTANALERRAFVLKDALFVIDDYVPSGVEGRELEAKAARVLRAQGNRAGRGRLRADLSDRPAAPPRGLLLATGEQRPPGQSVLARLLLVELTRASVDRAALTRAQALAGRLPHALAGYVGWLAPQMPTLAAVLRETFERARLRGVAGGEHLRIPEVVAHLWLGAHSGLSYAEELGVCSTAEGEDLRGRSWEALVALGRAQGGLVEGERPSRRFLAVLRTLLAQRRAVLLPRLDADAEVRPGVDLLGWEDPEALYLIPEAAFVAVTRLCRDTGEPFPVRQPRLWLDLKREGLSDAPGDRTTTTARIAGLTRRVLKLRRRAVEALLGEALPRSVTAVTSCNHFGEDDDETESLDDSGTYPDA
jgi:hypothetical protein